MNKQSVNEIKVSIDELANMVARGFKEAHLDLMAVRDELRSEFRGELQSEISKLRDEMNLKFTGISNQLDNIYLNYTTMSEHALLRDRVKRIERKIGISSVPDNKITK